MNQTDFFALLGAPLRNPQWSWGAYREEDNTVFLKVWKDELRPEEYPQRARLTFHSKWQGHDVKNGLLERQKHIARIHDGARCFLVMCEAADPTARPRKVMTFDEEQLFHAGKLLKLTDEHGVDEWIELGSSVPVRDVLIH